MKKQNWFTRLIAGFGGGKDAIARARQESKHGRGSRPSPAARAKRRKARKTRKAARRAQRGK